MTYRLRLLVDCVVGWIPSRVWNYLFKTFYRRPELAVKAGYTVFPRVFYNPFPLEEEIDRQKLQTRRDLPGIDLRVDEALELLKELAKFKHEFSSFPHDAQGRIEWHGTYPTLDSCVLYTMLRYLKPKRYIEVGCGYSTRLSTAALARNKEEGSSCEAVYIEPYPGSRLQGLKLNGRFLEKKVQDVDLGVFEALESGDVLFLDTTHILKVQNDVEFEFLRVLPRLKPGVVVHVHDIFTPYDYPEEWLLGSGPNLGANNEQYALECLLSGGGWNVLLPLYLMNRDQLEHVAEILVDAPDRAQAIWIQKK